MIFNINSTRGQTRFLTCLARVTCLVIISYNDFDHDCALHCVYKDVHDVIVLGDE